MKKIFKKENLKTVMHYLIAFFIPVVIFLFAMYLMDLWPFGDKSFRVIDAISQYPAFFEGLKDGDFFTFKIGMGANFYTIFTTYLANPINLFYLLFKNYQFDLFFLLLVLFKIGMIGLNMNILLNYKKKRSKYSWIFSTIYALSGFVSLYYFNYQFLDAVYMLPLVMIGIDKIVNDNKNLMYFITLTLTIIFHYYTAYMVCIFSVIYFFFLLINSELTKKEKKQRIIKFFVTSLFCGLCSSFIIIPSIYGLMQGRSSYYSNVKLWEFNKNSLSLFYDLTSGSFFIDDIAYGSSPIFVTLFIISLLINIFYSKENRKYKISVSIILIIYILSLSLNLFYYTWHCFQTPIFYPGRFVFGFDCLIILLTYKEFTSYYKNKVNNIKIAKIFILFITIIVFSFIYKMKISEAFKLDKRFVILIIFNLSLFLYYLFFMHNKKFYMLTFVLVILEITIHLICCFNSVMGLTNYSNLSVRNYYDTIKNTSKFIASFKNGSFFREDMDDKFSINSGLQYNFLGISYFNSLYNQNILSFGNDSMLHGEIDKHIAEYDGNVLMNSLLGVKYKYYYFKDELNCEYHPYVINSLGIVISDNKLLKNNIIQDNYKVLVNDKSSIFNELLLTPKIDYDNVVEKQDKFVLKDFKKDGKILLTYVIPYNSLVNINLNGRVENKKNGYFANFQDIMILKLNKKEVGSLYFLKKGDIVTLEVNIPKKIQSINKNIIKFEIFEENSYKKYIDYLNENIITDINFNHFGFTGNLQVNNEKDLLLLTIPYDESIEIKIDGETKEYNKYLGGIIGVPVSDGEHKIEFIYHIKGLKMGIIIAGLSLLSFISLEILLEKKGKKVYN